MHPARLLPPARLVGALLALAFAGAHGATAPATPAPAVELIGRYDLPRLQRILREEIPAAVGARVDYPEPRHAVRLFRVTYPSVIPEKANRPTLASGLVAIPEGRDGRLPLVSYQHGTVFGQREVPSFPEESFETRLMIALFAAGGYVVTGADYFGLGLSQEKDSYIVLGSQSQACLDLRGPARALLARESITPSDEFLAGWSQGGVVTMALLERMEQQGLPLRAVGTAAAQCDGYVMTSGFLDFPRPIEAWWVTTMFILTAFSFEEYYDVPGLAQGLFTPEQYPLARAIYLKDPVVKLEDFPRDLRKLIRPEFFDPARYRSSAYGRLAAAMQPYRWVIRTPVRMYYGEIDECLTVGLARLPMEYQRAIGNDRVTAISAGPDANHRITYARAAKEWLAWFEEQRSR